MEDLKKKARELKDSKSFVEAAALYEQIWETDKDKWVGYGLAFCYDKLENRELDKAISVSKAVYAQNLDFKINKDLLARLLNDKYFKHIEPDITPEDATKLLDIVIFMGEIVAHEKQSPLEFCSFRAISTAKKILAKYPAKKVVDILSKLTPELLSTSTYKATVKGRDMEMQSNLEAYYSAKTKALLELKQFEECLACCDDAFVAIDSFHYDNDVWLNQRKAHCIANLGDVISAITKLEELILHKDSCFLFFELAMLYWKAERFSDAQTMFLRALLSKEPDDKKVSLFVNFGDFLSEQNKTAESQMHYQYCKKIRLEKTWSISDNLQQKILAEADISYRQMKNYWISALYENSKVYEGSVSNIGKTGKTGFIKYSDGSIFFNFRNTVHKCNIQIGDKVTFIITASFDKMKNRNSIEANYIVVTH